MPSKHTTDLPTDVPSGGAKTQKGRFTDTSRYFVMNELKSVRFVVEDEIRALETFYHQDLCELLGDNKGERK